MLSDPNPLIEKGKYDLDREVNWLRRSGNKPRKDFNNQSQDGVSWYENYLESQKKLSKEDLEASPHFCYKDHKTGRCTECGIALDNNFYTLGDFQNINFSFIDPIQGSEDIKGLHIQTIYKPNCSQDMREFFLTLAGRKLQSLNDIFHKQKKLPLSLYKYLTQRISKDQNDLTTLRFDSNFESGNLSKVYYRGNNEYDLYLNVDTNTKGYCHWFFFSAACIQSPGKVTFHIKNMTKCDVGFAQGMKVSIFSKVDNTKNKCGWTLGGEDISYNTSPFKREVLIMNQRGHENHTDESDNEIDEEFSKENNDSLQGKNDSLDLKGNVIKKRKYNYFTLQFSYNFANDGDVVYFSNIKPYTFTDLMTFILQTEKPFLTEIKSKCESEDKFEISDFKPLEIVTSSLIYRREKICNTISGVPVFMITITGTGDPAKIKKRKGIFLTARVHPGENVSSFTMEGIIKYLLEDNPQTKCLRNFYVFKIVPMLNPEGVICGNNRTNPSGADLNRRWANPNEKLHPSIYYTKQAVAEFQREREIMLFCDIHGHSMKKNSFIYGCNTAADGGFCSWTKVRLFPRILANKTHMFNINDCTFRITPDKIGTARVTCWKEFKITNSFTWEISLWGFDYGDQVIQFTPEHLYQLGRDFLSSLLEYTYVWAELTKELFLSGGWLKPNRLLEVTGVPAQNKLQLQLKEEKEEKRKQILKERLKNQQEKVKKKSAYRIRTNKGQISPSRDSFVGKVALGNKSNKRFGYSDDESENPFYHHMSTEWSKKDMNQDSCRFFTDSSDRDQKSSPEKRENYFKSKTAEKTQVNQRELSFIENILEIDVNARPDKSESKQDWREYFKTEELDENYKMILDGKDPNELECDPESGSEDSDEGFEKEVIEQLKNPIPVKKPFFIKPNAIKTLSKPRDTGFNQPMIVIDKPILLPGPRYQSPKPPTSKGKVDMETSTDELPIREKFERFDEIRPKMELGQSRRQRVPLPRPHMIFKQIMGGKYERKTGLAELLVIKGPDLPKGPLIKELNNIYAWDNKRNHSDTAPITNEESYKFQKRILGGLKKEQKIGSSNSIASKELGRVIKAQNPPNIQRRRGQTEVSGDLSSFISKNRSNCLIENDSSNQDIQPMEGRLNTTEDYKAE